MSKTTPKEEALHQLAEWSGGIVFTIAIGLVFAFLVVTCIYAAHVWPQKCCSKSNCFQVKVKEQRAE